MGCCRHEESDSQDLPEWPKLTLKYTTIKKPTEKRVRIYYRKYITARLLSRVTRFAGRDDRNCPNLTNHMRAWHPNIKSSGNRCALLLCVQENMRVLLQHTKTRQSTNRPHDSISLPECEILLDTMAHGTVHLVYIQTNLINKGILKFLKFARIIALVSYSRWKWNFTPPVSRLLQKKCYGLDRARRYNTDSTKEHREQKTPKLLQAKC